MNWLFYAFDCPRRLTAHLPDSRYRGEIWKPVGLEIRPAGLPLWPFGAWWAFHELRVFYNREYCLILVRDGKQLVHRSCMFPGYFRFPFMTHEDLQIGDVWTDVKYRGIGLATYGIERAIELAGERVRRIWYVVEESNVRSIRLVEKVGFACVARGIRTHRLGISLLGAFQTKSFSEMNPPSGSPSMTKLT
jgi:RimJ/RimL family protein N-acetyltransferase